MDSEGSRLLLGLSVSDAQQGSWQWVESLHLGAAPSSGGSSSSSSSSSSVPSGGGGGGGQLSPRPLSTLSARSLATPDIDLDIEYPMYQQRAHVLLLPSSLVVQLLVGGGRDAALGAPPPGSTSGASALLPCLLTQMSHRDQQGADFLPEYYLFLLQPGPLQSDSSSSSSGEGSLPSTPTTCLARMDIDASLRMHGKRLGVPHAVKGWLRHVHYLPVGAELMVLTAPAAEGALRECDQDSIQLPEGRLGMHPLHTLLRPLRPEDVVADL